MILELKSTIKVTNEADVKPATGVVSGQSVKWLVGAGGGIPSERITVILASFKPGTYEELHWHLIEGVYYVISGRAIMKDIEGKTYNLKPGSVVYAPPGFTASHSWDIKEPLQLICVRATTDPETLFQFTVDKDKRSSVEFNQLNRRGAANFRKSLYSE